MTERTDRELLELAAKAADVHLEWDGPMELWQPMYYEGKTYHAWDPLLDDATALRLAVRLSISVYHAVSVVHARGYCGEYCTEPYREDQCAAVRRAIVRAAAAMAEGGE
jgi:hypothetical protein